MATAVIKPNPGMTPDPPRLARGLSVWSVSRTALLRSPGRIFGCIIILIFIVMAIAGPFFYPSNLPANANAIYASPSWAHPLGTDFEGTDVLALLIVGARYVLVSAVVAGIFAVVLGAVIGLTAGYRRGLTDTVLGRLVDFVLTVPSLPLLIIIAAVLRFSSPILIGLILGVTGWAGIARAVRSQTLSLRERPFVEACRGLGLSTKAIVARELLPNVAPYIAMNLLVSIIGAIYAETGLFFLGVLPANVNNWGVMLNLAVFQAGAIGNSQAIFYLLAPLVTIMLLTLGIVLVLDAVDEIFNPRLRS